MVPFRLPSAAAVAALPATPDTALSVKSKLTAFSPVPLASVIFVLPNFFGVTRPSPQPAAQKEPYTSYYISTNLIQQPYIFHTQGKRLCAKRHSLL